MEVSEAGHVFDAGHEAATEAAAEVFVSYARKDVDFVDRLAAALETHYVTPAIDRAEIYAFEDWWKRIEALIAAADTVVFVLSPDALASEICRKEVDCALALNKRFAPIVCRSVADEMAKIPPALAALNFIFFDAPGSFDDAVAKLVEALRTDIRWVRFHTAYGLDAAEWERARRPNGLLLRSPRLEDAERWIAGRPPDAPAPTEATQAFILASRRGATRRRNTLTGGLAAGLVVSLGLAGLALWQRGEALTQRAQAIQQRKMADAQRKIAERNFSAAKATVDGLVFDIAQGLRDTSGMRVETIRKILGTARGTLDRLLAASPENPRLLRSKAGMLSEFARTYFAAGDLKDADATARENVALNRRLAAQSPGDANAQRGLLISLFARGDALREAGDASGALEVYQESLAIARKLAAPDGDARAQHDLSTALILIGSAKQRAGDAAAALAAFEESLAIVRKLAARDPGADATQLQLSWTLNVIGALKRASDDLPGALAADRECLAVVRGRAANHPDDSLKAYQVAAALAAVADITGAVGDRGAALAAYQESLAIFRRLAAQDPSDTQVSRALMLTLTAIADTKFHAADENGALAAYQESLAALRKLAAHDPGNAELKLELSTSLEKLGELESMKGDRKAALDAYGESLAGLRAPMALDPRNAAFENEAKIDLERIGNEKLGARDANGALAAYLERLALLRKDAARDPANAARQRAIASALIMIATAKRGAADPGGALAAYSESLSISRDLARAHSSDPVFQRSLVSALDGVGMAKLQSGDAAGAVLVDQECVALARQVMTTQADDANDSLAATRCLSGLAKASQARGDRPGALAAYREALPIARDRARKGYARAKDNLAYFLNGSAYLALFTKDYARALAESEEAAALTPDDTSLQITRTYALMMLGRNDDARAIYLKYRDSIRRGTKTWATSIGDDVAALRKAGIAVPSPEAFVATSASPVASGCPSPCAPTPK